MTGDCEIAKHLGSSWPAYRTQGAGPPSLDLACHTSHRCVEKRERRRLVVIKPNAAVPCSALLFYPYPMRDLFCLLLFSPCLASTACREGGDTGTEAQCYRNALSEDLH